MSIGQFAGGGSPYVGEVYVKIVGDTSGLASQLKNDVKEAARAAGGNTLTGAARPGRQAIDEFASSIRRSREEGERFLAQSRETSKQMEVQAGSTGALGRRFVGLGATAIVGYQALNEVSSALRVTGEAAGTTEGRFRNLGAELLQGNIIGGLKALAAESSLGAVAMEQLVREIEGADLSNLQKITEFAQATGNEKLLGQIQGIQTQVRASSIADQETAAGLTDTRADDLAAAQRIEREAAIGIKVYQKGTAAYTKAFQDYARAVKERESIQAAIAKERKDSADKAKEQASNREDGVAQAAANQVVIAGLTAGLQDDLAAAQKVEALYQQRLKVAQSGSRNYTETLAKLGSAHSEVLSITGQIESEQKRYRDEQTRLAKEAADEAKRAREEAAAAAKREREEAARQYRADLDYEQGQIELQLKRAQLTEKNLNDDKRAQRKLVALLKQRVKDAKLTREERQQAASQLIDAQLGLRDLNRKKTAPDAVGAGTSNFDFFNEAARNFTELGSNITGRGGILSGQDARASYSARVLTGAGAQSFAAAIERNRDTRAQTHLTEAQKQTALLKTIADGILRYGTPAPQKAKGRGGVAIEQARFSVVNG